MGLQGTLFVGLVQATADASLTSVNRILGTQWRKAAENLPWIVLYPSPVSSTGLRRARNRKCYVIR